MNDREFITSIRDQCNAQLGGASIPPPASSSVAPITSKPSPDIDLHEGYGPIENAPMQAGVVQGFAFRTRRNVASRVIEWSGRPGGFWDRCSWAVFDSGGGRVFGADDVLISNSMGMWQVGSPQLMTLAPDVTYTFALAVNGSGNLGVQFNQQP